jgi:predicted protein tyrosine phosphatase
MKMKIFAASQYLNDMVNNKGHRVFIHCSSGITRAPTVALLYLCLFKRHNSWRDVDQVDQYLSSHYHVSYPNRNLVSQIIKDNHEFQTKQQEPVAVVAPRQKNPILQKLLDEEK